MTQEITVSDAVIINELRAEVLTLRQKCQTLADAVTELTQMGHRLTSEEYLYNRSLKSTNPLELDTLAKLYDNSQYYGWLRTGEQELNWDKFYKEFGNDATEETWQALRVLKSI